MRAQQPIRRGATLATRACIAGAAAAAAHAAPAAAAVPPPCGGVAQIADAAGDGHHDNTDVTAAWLSEESGRLQAVIRPRVAVWEPAHDDSDAAGFAFLFAAGDTTRYVRAEAPRGGPVRFDHGAWTPAGGFASAGPTTGEAVAGSGGAVVIDVPGVAAGTVLARPFVLTYDGMTGTAPHWVDRAPGGVAPDGVESGADFVAGTCAGSGPGPAPGPGGGTATTTAVVLDAPRRIVGGGRAVIGGRVAPARAGVTVELTASARRSAVRRARYPGRRHVLPARAGARDDAPARGRRGHRLADAHAHGRLAVRIHIARTRGGAAVVRGRVSPRLPGRVLLLRANGVEAGRVTAKPGTAASASACAIPAAAATRPCSSRAASVPSGPRPTQESSDEVHSHRRRARRRRLRSRFLRPRPRIRRSTRATRSSPTTRATRPI